MHLSHKNVSFVEANVKNISAQFQLYPPHVASDDMMFEYLLANLAFQLTWPPTKLSETDIYDRGLFNDHFKVYTIRYHFCYIPNKSLL